MTLAEILLSVFYHLSVLSQVSSFLQVTKTIDTGHFNAETLNSTWDVKVDLCKKTLKVDDNFVKTKFSVKKKKKKKITTLTLSSRLWTSWA